MAKLLREFFVHGGGRWGGGRRTPEHFGWKMSTSASSTGRDVYKHPKHQGHILTVRRSHGTVDSVGHWEHETSYPEESLVNRGRGTNSLAPHLEKFHKNSS